MGARSPVPQPRLSPRGSQCAHTACFAALPQPRAAGSAVLSRSAAAHGEGGTLRGTLPVPRPSPSPGCSELRPKAAADPRRRRERELRAEALYWFRVFNATELQREGGNGARRRRERREDVTDGWGTKPAGRHTAGRRRRRRGPQSCSPPFGCAAHPVDGALHRPPKEGGLQGDFPGGGGGWRLQQESFGRRVG